MTLKPNLYMLLLSFLKVFLSPLLIAEITYYLHLIPAYPLL